jgi:hypothetical protein
MKYILNLIVSYRLSALEQGQTLFPSIFIIIIIITILLLS